MSEPSSISNQLDLSELDNSVNPRNSTVGTRRSFVILVAAITVSWLIVAFATRAIENLFFIKLKFNGESFWQTLFITIIIALFFFAIVWTIDQYSIENETRGQLESRILEFDGPVSFRDFNLPRSNVVFST